MNAQDENGFRIQLGALWNLVLGLLFLLPLELVWDEKVVTFVALKLSRPSGLEELLGKLHLLLEVGLVR